MWRLWYVVYFMMRGHADGEKRSEGFEAKPTRRRGRSSGIGRLFGNGL